MVTGPELTRFRKISTLPVFNVPTAMSMPPEFVVIPEPNAIVALPPTVTLTGPLPELVIWSLKRASRFDVRLSVVPVLWVKAPSIAIPPVAPAVRLVAVSATLPLARFVLIFAPKSSLMLNAVLPLDLL